LSVGVGVLRRLPGRLGVPLVGRCVGVLLVARRRLGRVARAVRGRAAAGARAAVTAVATVPEYREEDGDDDHDARDAGEEEDFPRGRLLLFLGLAHAVAVVGGSAGIRRRGR
jgi:hypothetical protein